MADVELLRTVFLRMLAEKTGQEFDAEGLVGLFTSQWAGSISDIGETQPVTPCNAMGALTAEGPVVPASSEVWSALMTQRAGC